MSGMIVVADTSPINYLILLGQIEVLVHIYGAILIPQAVLQELQDDEAPAEVSSWIARRPVWLKVSDAIFQPDSSLNPLDRGEHDAILLAESTRANRLTIDDLDGRREAIRRNIPVIGTLGVLAEAARRDLLSLPQTLAALQMTNFHVSPELTQKLLAEDAKRRR